MTIVGAYTTPAIWPWESQVWQYPQVNRPGIHYFRGDIPDTDLSVDCLLFYGKDRRLHGILNYYGEDFNDPDGLERPGNVNVFVDPQTRRQGIATALLDEARRRWPFDPEQQGYTPEGRAFINSYWARVS